MRNVNNLAELLEDLSAVAPQNFLYFLFSASRRGCGGAAKNGKEIFGVRPPERSGSGAEASDSNAYAEVSHHHALRAWHIVSDFENRCELGKIKAPKRNWCPV